MRDFYAEALAELDMEFSADLPQERLSAYDRLVTGWSVIAHGVLVLAACGIGGALAVLFGWA